MEHPTDGGGQLLRFGARQQDAVVQCMLESVGANPALLTDQLFVHEGYLSGRTAESEAADFQPHHEGLPKAWRLVLRHV